VALLAKDQSQIILFDVFKKQAVKSFSWTQGLPVEIATVDQVSKIVLKDHTGLWCVDLIKETALKIRDMRYDLVKDVFVAKTL
jgi:hypothetical protein